MKFMSFLLFFILIIISSNLQAQEWSDAQMEVWKTVQGYYSMVDKQDLDGFISYLDDSYTGWDIGNDKPMNKTEKAADIKKYFEATKGITVKSEIVPLQIWVQGDMAFVHYNFSMLSTDQDGKSTKLSGRWTDILHKKDGKWLCVGDHGGVSMQKGT